MQLHINGINCTYSVFIRRGEREKEEREREIEKIPIMKGWEVGKDVVEEEMA